MSYEFEQTAITEFRLQITSMLVLSSANSSTSLMCLSHIEFAAEEIREAENVYKEYTVEIYEVEFRVNLIPIPMTEGNEVVGMDWSSRNRANVDSAGQLMVVYGKREQTKMAFCSIAKMGKHLQRGYTDDLACALVNRFEGSTCSRCNSERVLGNYFLGFLADRQVEFGIDLILGSTPVAKTPNCLAPLSSKSYLVSYTSFRRKGSLGRVATLGVRHVRIVKKKDGSHRMCSDYWEFKEVTIEEQYLLSRIGDSLISFRAWRGCNN
ncbi:hypothetical protein OSB04_032105 [Centaurea solstitialis]|uniref:Uncharacterized protein n=1 Tax=Centaurea solstitialis TaxID=347529 RepID=A0AA38VY82_9ASTR|nr:hypothetical protein OSB04_032105 [Centaurea solstitialis]